MGDQDNRDEADAWSGILAAVSFTMRSKYHTTVQATPAQLALDRDALLNIKFQGDWNLIEKHKPQHTNENN